MDPATCFEVSPQSKLGDKRKNHCSTIAYAILWCSRWGSWGSLGAFSLSTVASPAIGLLTFYDGALSLERTEDSSPQYCPLENRVEHCRMAELGQMALHIVQYFKGGPTSDHLMHILHHFSRDGQVLAALH